MAGGISTEAVVAVGVVVPTTPSSPNVGVAVVVVALDILGPDRLELAEPTQSLGVAPEIPVAPFMGELGELEVEVLEEMAARVVVLGQMELTAQVRHTTLEELEVPRGRRSRPMGTLLHGSPVTIRLRSRESSDEAI